FLLCEKDIVKRPLLYLSYYFKQHRQEYYNRLQATRDTGDWESWLKFFLHGVRSVADEATRTARDIITMREAHREIVRDRFGRGAARALLAVESLYFNPIVSVNWIMERTDLAFARANELVRELVDLGLLAEITGLKRNRRFSYAPYLALFADPLTEPPDVENAE
ncbi:MAG: Fic family protein, partial [Chloroflexota bacterium]|nr:Fic family protein [Chloroflexota bacterium]